MDGWRERGKDKKGGKEGKKVEKKPTTTLLVVVLQFIHGCIYIYI